MTKPRVNECQAFQEAVEQSLLRHSSILDVLSKLHETTARVHRATIKAITDCGCVSVKASKQAFPPDCCFESVREYFTSHVEGALCEHCREVLALELGHNLFYAVALCSTLGISFEDVFVEEQARIKTLGRFNLR